jgi:hypothetical protein
MDSRQTMLGQIPYYNVAAALGFAQLSAADQNMTFLSDIGYLFRPKDRSYYRALNVTGILLPSELRKAPEFYVPVYESSGLKAYRVPGEGYWDVVGIPRIEAVDSGQTYLERTKEWLRTLAKSPDRYPAIVPTQVSRGLSCALPAASRSRGSAWGSVVRGSPLERGKARAELMAESDDAYGLYRASYHPHWEIRVNGAKAEPKWAGPGFLAFSIPRGKSTVELSFPADPVRSTLFLIGMMSLILISLRAYFPRVDIGIWSCSVNPGFGRPFAWIERKFPRPFTSRWNRTNS